MDNDQPAKITATDIAQYVRLESCERYLWYRLHPKDTRALLREYRVSEQPLSPLLSAQGARHEDEVTKELSAQGIEVVDMTDQGAEAVIEQLRKPVEGRRALTQPRLEGTLGPFEAAGLADLVQLEASTEGLMIRVEDAKSSRKDKPEHRLQVAFYAHLLRQMAATAGVDIAAMTGAIWRIPADEDDEQPVPFNLEPYEEALELLTDDAGVARKIAGGPKEEARYHLTYKCDGCLYNAICSREAAETKSLTLVPFMSQRDRAILERNGVSQLRDLATLKELPAQGSTERALKPSSGQEEVVQRLNSEWPLGAHLDLHVQRARAVARAHGEDVAKLGWIHRAGFGSMPSRDTYQDLVQVFIEGHHDYLQDRLYALSALVQGPKERSREVLKLAEQPPEDASEAEFIIDWLRDVLAAAREVARGDEAVVHIYVFDRYDQKVILDALRRHIDALAGIPEFYDLLTESAALSQGMFSFLAQEVRERKNLGILAHSLPMTARRLGFDWAFEGTEYHRVFQARIFDNRRTLDDGRWYESAARFNSQIPLEYAYATWGRLPDDENSRPLLAPFNVTRAQLLGFLRARLHALRHIEASFSMKNKYLRKEPVKLPEPRTTTLVDPSLARVLVEFLYLEHHAKLQTSLLLFNEPMDRRVASGQSIIAEALEDCDGGAATLRFRFEEAELDAIAARDQMNPKEGDWMVMSPANSSRTPWQVLQGRIATIESINDDGLQIDLKTMTLFGAFRYKHDKEMPLKKGTRYVLDPMVDEFVAERLLDACRNTDHNDFLRWIETGGNTLDQRPTTDEAKLTSDFLERVSEAPGILTPTARQAEVIGGHLDDRVLLVQGPPGTGKTHTIAWAVLGRAYAAAQQGQPFRVLVSSMTHTAVEVVLRSILGKMDELRSDRTAADIADVLENLRLFKETWHPNEPVPARITRVGKEGFLEAIRENLVVIGAVPGGVHRLLQGAGQPIDWEKEYFDLVVIDEASQVNLPAAVLAGAALRPEGQALVVGDHRQMPPIFVHEWEDEPRRGVQDSRIYASTFEALRERNFPEVGLDQSFRLHKMHAAFLEEHIYFEDEVGFHSNREDLLPRVEGLEGHVAAALQPEFPVVIVEHAEASSLKRNDTEAAIVTPIITAATDKLRLDPNDGLGVVVPHRAQRAALRKLFPELGAANAIDTVERFQGGERDLIIVSATASDPEFVLSEAKFLLNPNRLNVAFSRPRKKLIIVGSTTIFRLMPPDAETFENALLWKRLRYEFSATTLWEGEVGSVPVRVSGRRIEPREGEA